jgi:hypothetical protein
MPLYRSFDPQTEVMGIGLLGFTRSIVHNNLAEILARYHLDHIDPQGWYPVQTLLDVFGEISSGMESSPIFISLGVAVSQVVLQSLTAEAKAVSLHQFFSGYDAFWKSRHRNGDMGYVNYERVSENQIIMRVRTPYPDDLIYGLIYGYARYFCPKDQTVSVAYDEHLPSRDTGAEETLIHIRLQ